MKADKEITYITYLMKLGFYIESGYGYLWMIKRPENYCFDLGERIFRRMLKEELIIPGGQDYPGDKYILK